MIIAMAVLLVVLWIFYDTMWGITPPRLQVPLPKDQRMRDPDGR